MTNDSEPSEPQTNQPESTGEPAPSSQTPASESPWAPPRASESPPAETGLPFADAAPAARADPPPAPPRRRPRWLSFLIYAGIAVVPAVVVGLVVFFVAGNDSGGGNDGSAGLVDTFLRLGTASEDDVFSYNDVLPPGYPADLPTYPGAKLVASFFVPTQQGGVYLAFYSAPDSAPVVTRFYEQSLDQDPWQVEGAHRATKDGGLAFKRPADVDVEGSVTVRRSDLGDSTDVIIQLQDLTPDSAQLEPPNRPFVLPASMELPPGFPDDVAIYSGSSGPSTVTETAFQRTTVSADFLVTFLTKDGQSDVIDYYRQEFEKRGWTVTDAVVSPNSFTRGIDFTDDKSELQGSLTADAFEDDSSYTQVDLLVSVSPQRGRGN